MIGSEHFGDWTVQEVVDCRDKTSDQLGDILKLLGVSPKKNGTKEQRLSVIERVYNELNKCMRKNFSKVFVSGANTKSGGIMDMFCPHGVCLGFKVLIGAERPSVGGRTPG